jgi:MFS family permease
MTDEPAKMYCANHPDVETTLRCNRCEKPICAKCAVLTPTGYRCKECIRGQQKIFDTATWADYPLVLGTVAVLAFLGSLIAFRVGFFVILLAPAAGGIIAEIARRITRRHRSKRLFLLASAAAVIGCIPIALQFILQLNLYSLLWQVAYAILMTSAMYARLAGIRIG